nr:MAG TPA: hypothetical protein [Caudoviricetes sp.]
MVKDIGREYIRVPEKCGKNLYRLLRFKGLEIVYSI